VYDRPNLSDRPKAQLRPEPTTYLPPIHWATDKTGLMSCAIKPVLYIRGKNEGAAPAKMTRPLVKA